MLLGSLSWKENPKQCILQFALYVCVKNLQSDPSVQLYWSKMYFISHQYCSGVVATRHWVSKMAFQHWIFCNALQHFATTWVMFALCQYIILFYDNIFCQQL